MSSIAVERPRVKPLTAGKRLKAVLGGAAGNFVEWFDWFVFLSFSLYFSPVFFPQGDRTVQLLQSAAVLALGFAVRPLGAWLIGLFADRRGRRAALALSVGMMCLGSCIIALAPGYGQIGIAAPAILLVARLLQGMSVGGEYGASATYISEMAGRERRGLWSSLQCVTLVSGQLTALALLLLLQAVLTKAQLGDWGWRIPFLIGALFAIIVYWIRRGLEETGSWQKGERASHAPATARQLLVAHRRATLMVFALTAAGSTGFYVYLGYMQKFLVNTSGFPASVATSIMAAALILFLVVQPICGWLSDVFGRRRVLIVSFAATALCTVPVLSLLAATTDAFAAFFLVTLPLLLFSGYTALGAVVKAELYPVHIRALGVGLPYAVANAIFGGTGELLALWCKQSGWEEAFYFYLAAMMTLGLIVAIILPDTRDKSLIIDD